MGPRPRRAVAGICGLVLLSVLWRLPGASAVEGQLTNIGGNGPLDKCELTSDQFRNPPVATKVGGGGFNRSTGMQGIAVDASGQRLFLAAGGRIVDRNGLIAGGGTTTEDAAEGVAGLEVKFPPIAGIATDPRGTALWVLEPGAQQGTTFGQGHVRKIDLQSTNHAVTTAAAVGTNPTGIAADASGNVYVTDGAGAVSEVGAGVIGTVPGAATAIAVDATGQAIYVSDAHNVYRLNGTTGPERIAGDAFAHADGGNAALTDVKALAVGNEIDGSAIRARYLYIADARRVLRVDLVATPNVITTVAGGGSSFVSGTAAGTAADINPSHLAADLNGHVYIAALNQCAIFQLDTPPAFNRQAPVTNVTSPPTTQKPADPTETKNPQDVATGQPVKDNVVAQPDGTGGGTTNNGQVNDPGITSSNQVQPDGQIVDPGTATTPQVVVPQATPQPFPTSDAGTFSVPFNLNPFPGLTPDAGATIGASANTGVVLPVPPAAPTPLLPPVPDPSPIAASGAPPPAAPQPVSNIALVGGDTQAARGAARYAMVRNDDDSAMAAATMALGGVVLAVFLCVLLVAPGTSSGPKPRPKGAY